MTVPDFELRQLHYFLALAGELHFSRASRQLYISQSALSQQISRLEEGLGVRLFYRDKHKVALTPAGRLFIEGARATLDAAQFAAAQVKQFATNPGLGRLRIGYLEYAFSNVVLSALTATMRSFPKAKLEGLDLAVGQLVPALIAGTIDIGVGLLPFIHEQVESEQVFIGHWMALLPSAHPLANQPRIKAEELAKERLVLFQRALNPVLYDNILKALRQLNLPLQIVYEIAQIQVGPSLVKEGIGIFMIASYAVPPLEQGLIARPIDGLGVDLHIGTCWRKGEETALMHEFREALRKRQHP